MIVSFYSKAPKGGGQDEVLNGGQDGQDGGHDGGQDGGHGEGLNGGHGGGQDGGQDGGHCEGQMEDTVEDRKCHKPMAFVSIPEVDVFVLTSIRKNPIK